MEIVAKLFGKLLVFLYHCFDRIVINGYLSGLSRPEQVMYLFRQVVGVRPPHGSHPARVREAIKACPTPRRRPDIARLDRAPAQPLRHGHSQAREGERVDPGRLGRGAEPGSRKFGSREGMPVVIRRGRDSVF